MARAAIIINEFGEIGIDQLLITKPKEDMVVLSNGCLCCAVRGDLVDTLASMWRERQESNVPAFDKVVIETSGLADPTSIMLTVTSDEDISQRYVLDGVLTVVDAVQSLAQMAEHPEAVRQVIVADRILVTKNDIAEAEAVRQLRRRIGRLNPMATLYDVDHGRIDVGLLFNVHPDGRTDSPEKIVEWLRLERAEKACGHDHDCGCHHDHHDHGAGHHTRHGHDHFSPAHSHDIRSYSMFYDGVVTPDGLQVWMDAIARLRGPDMLRIKGLVNVEGHPIVIQAVQHLFHPPVELKHWPDAERRSRLVFITQGITREEIEATFSAFSLPLSHGDGSAPDPEGYQRFVEAMRAAL
jgi:G3E family GTPase